MFICKFNKRSTVGLVKIRLFRSCCICVYGAGLLDYTNICHHRCIKLSFGYNRMHSVTAILFDLGLPSFDTLMHNYGYSFCEQWTTSLYTVV